MIKGYHETLEMDLWTGLWHEIADYADHPVIFEHPLMTQEEKDWLLGLASQLEGMDVAGEA